MLEIRKRFHLTGHKDSIYALESSQDGKNLYSAGNDGMLVEWDVSNGEGKVIAKAENSIYTIRLVDNSRIAIGENYKGVRILNTESKKEEAFYPVDNLQIFDICFIEQGILVACSKGWIYFFDKNGDKHTKISFSKKNVRTMLLSPGPELVVGFSDESIRILTLPDLKIRKEFKAHDKSVFAMALTKDNKWLLTVGRDAKIKTWSLADDFLLAGEIPAHHYAINSIALSNDNKHFVTCSMDKTLKVWDTYKGKLLKVIDNSRFEGHQNSVNNVVWFSRDSLASVGDDNMLMLWVIHGLD